MIVNYNTYRIRSKMWLTYRVIIEWSSRFPRDFKMLFNANANKGNERSIKIGEEGCFSESKKFSIKLS